jgi:tetratricopeptide (TPR) repeat protein
MLRSLGGFVCVCAVVLAAGIAPAQAGMQNDLALCTAAEGRPSAAACTRVMNSGRLRDEDVYIGYYNRADSYEKAGDFDKALADLNKVVELRPKFARGYLARGLVQDDLGATDKALADLASAIALKPDDAGIYVNRATVLRGKQDFDAALADLKKVADLDPKREKVALQRAIVLAESGDADGATAAADAIFTSATPDAAAYYVRATVAFAQDRLDAAQSDAERSLKLNASFAGAHTLMGRIEEKRGNAAAAKSHYQAALKSVSSDFDRRLAQKTARERIAALGGVEAASVASNQETPAPNQETPEPGCKRFLPATGTIISATCD